MAYKIIDFDQYCCHCEHECESEMSMKCFECIGAGAREDSRVPLNFKCKENCENPVKKGGSSVDFSVWKG